MSTMAMSFRKAMFRGSHLVTRADPAALSRQREPQEVSAYQITQMAWEQAGKHLYRAMDEMPSQSSTTPPSSEH